ncbi:hypothetical protein B9Z19DRAFT_1062393 [Tuber borchii]|uniref:Uncharacterized protein n=1 Tax=Tuber borchii TaxID=42251 RepID=A0A2T7A203_TUBBO|nr:hypothetical protein B9Z19DRAFT_1062393 [Tuber borchii]
MSSPPRIDHTQNHSLHVTPQIPSSTPNPTTPNNCDRKELSSTEPDTLEESLSEIPLLDQQPSLIPTPQEWKRRRANEAASTLLNLPDDTPLAQSIGWPSRNPNRVPGWWAHLSQYQALDPRLSEE